MPQFSLAHLPVSVESAGEHDIIVSISQLSDSSGSRVGIDMFLSDIAEDV